MKRFEFSPKKSTGKKLILYWLPYFFAAAAIVLAFMANFYPSRIKTGPATLAIVGLLLSYIVYERATVLEELRVSNRSDRVKHYLSMDLLYLAAADEIARQRFESSGNRQIFHVAFHGNGKARQAAKQNSAFEAFMSEMDYCVTSSGPNMWYVKTLFNITDEDRLEEVLKRLRQWDDAEGLEVRSFALLDNLPGVTPLVIGDECVFFADDHKQFYRADNGFMVRGQEPVRIAVKHFNDLWEDSRTFHLRQPTGINDEQVKNLRERIRADKKS